MALLLEDAHVVEVALDVLQPGTHELDAVAGEMASTIAANAPLSVAAAKRMVWETAGMPLATAFERAEELFAPAYLSEDAQEGPRAFREGRAPRWSGA